MLASLFKTSSNNKIVNSPIRSTKLKKITSILYGGIESAEDGRSPPEIHSEMRQTSHAVAAAVAPFRHSTLYAANKYRPLHPRLQAARSPHPIRSHIPAAAASVLLPPPDAGQRSFALHPSVCSHLLPIHAKGYSACLLHGCLPMELRSPSPASSARATGCWRGSIREPAPPGGHRGPSSLIEPCQYHVALHPIRLPPVCCAVRIMYRTRSHLLFLHVFCCSFTAMASDRTNRILLSA